MTEQQLREGELASVLSLHEARAMIADVHALLRYWRSLPFGLLPAFADYIRIRLEQIESRYVAAVIERESALQDQSDTHAAHSHTTR